MKSIINIGFLFLCVLVFCIPIYRTNLFVDFKIYVGLFVIVNFIISNKNKLLIVNKRIQLYNHKLFFIWLIISSVLTPNWEFNEFFLVLYFFAYLFFLIIVNYVTDTKRIIFISKVIVLTLAFQIFVIIMQYLGFKEFYFQKVEFLNVNTGINSDNIGAITRYWGTLSNALTLSTFLTPLSIGLIVFLLDIRAKIIILLLTVSTTIFSIYLTGSRSGMITFLFLLLLYFYKKRAFNKWTLVVISLIILMSINTIYIFFQSDEGLSRFLVIEDDIRFNMWANSYKILLDDPIIGTTIGCLYYGMVKHDLVPSYMGELSHNIHLENVYISILMATGVVGFYFFIKIIATPYAIGKHINESLKINKLISSLFVAYQYGYWAILICMFAEPSVYLVSNNLLLFFFLSGIICSFTNLLINKPINPLSRNAQNFYHLTIDNNYI